MAQPQADRVWVAMAETSAGALVERVAEAGAECMDGDLEGQDGLKGFSVAGIHLRGASAGVKFLLQVVRASDTKQVPLYVQGQQMGL